MTTREKIEFSLLILFTCLIIALIIIMPFADNVALAEESSSVCVEQYYSNVDYSHCNIYFEDRYICTNSFFLDNAKGTIFDSSVFQLSSLTDMNVLSNDNNYGYDTLHDDSGYVASYFEGDYAMQLYGNYNTFLQIFIPNCQKLLSSIDSSTMTYYIYNSETYYEVYGCKLELESGKIIEYNIYKKISENTLYSYTFLRTIKVNGTDYIVSSVSTIDSTYDSETYFSNTIALGNGIVNSNISKIYYRSPKYNTSNVVFINMPLAQFSTMSNQTAFTYAYNSGDFYTYANLIHFAEFDTSLFENLYRAGYNEGYYSAETLNNLDWLSSLFDSLMSFFNIQLFGNVTLGLLLFIPLILSILLFIFKLARG